MEAVTKDFQRRTTIDALYDHLHEEIVSLKLPPGTKLSETEVAQRFGVSRQPVRDAFNRLWNEDLLLIRPQKTTEVRRFSLERIAQCRFLRLAVELEVLRTACQSWDRAGAEKLERNLDDQRRALKQGRQQEFYQLDLQYHLLICEFSGLDPAAKFIAQCRQKTDRLCNLGLDHENEAKAIIEDHTQLAIALSNNDEAAATKVMRRHLSRLDSVIDVIHAANASYFE